VQTVDRGQHRVVGGFEAELDPDRDALGEFLEHGQGFVGKTIGPGGDAHDQHRVAQPGLDDREHFLEAPRVAVGVGVGLEVGDDAYLGVASSDAGDALLELLGQLATRTQGTGARALDIAVGASAETARAVAIGAGRAGVEGDTIDGLAEALDKKESAVEFYDRVFSLDINFADGTERLRELR
jgi:hypothetical protein